MRESTSTVPFASKPAIAPECINQSALTIQRPYSICAVRAAFAISHHFSFTLAGEA